MPHSLPLSALAAPLALCRLPASNAVPAWTGFARTFLTISRTPTELSIVADRGRTAMSTRSAAIARCAWKGRCHST